MEGEGGGSGYVVLYNVGRGGRGEWLCSVIYIMYGGREREGGVVM